MRWTYGNNPAGSVSDEVRFLVGDTDRCDPQLDDAEVAYCLSASDNDPLTAAIAAARGLMMRYARAVDETVGPVSISWSQRFANIQAVVTDLLGRQESYGAIVWAGGTSRAESHAIEADPDRIRPWFQRNSLEDPTLDAGDRAHSELGPSCTDPLLGNE